ncbi:NAD(P)-binding oxidoreductase [Devosia sp.]|uniref:NAD(P)-binding oxidoreductase n=1 Tax=Devosia sp. TaxID=1871048 RepID=UPI0032671CAD
MRITVFGSHGRTGLLLVQLLLAAGHQVVATIRNPGHMADLVKLGAETRMVDLDKSAFEDVVEACKGSDAVIFAAGSAAGEGSALDRKGTLRTVRATEKAGVRRYISVSSIGASTGMSTRTMDDEMKDYYKQKRAAAKHIAGSTLDWTLIEPAELTDEPGTGKVTASLVAIKETAIARADVAAVIGAVLTEPKSIGKAIQLAGGGIAINAALNKALG